MSQIETSLPHPSQGGTIPAGFAIFRPASRAGWTTRLRGRFFGFTARKSMIALADQTIVSGTSFLTTVLVGRMCGAEALGAYSLGFSLVVLAQSVLNALVLVPYTVYANRSEGRRQRLYAGMTLVQTAALAVAAVTVAVVWATFLARGTGQREVGAVVWSLAALLPFVILREFARRFSFAHFHASRVLVLDAVAATIQVSGLLLLSLSGWLTASRALFAMGTACAVAGVTWLLVNWPNFRVSVKGWKAAVAKNWRFGRWVFASQLIGQLNSDTLLLWLLVFMLGKAAAGVYSACMSIVLFSNPFILGVSYVLTPRIAQAYSRGGCPELRRIVLKTAVTIGCVMAMFCVAVLLLGGATLHLLFGSQYAGHEITIFVLAVGILIRSIGMGVSNGLWAIDRPEANFQANAAGLFVTLAAAMALVPLYQLTGTAMSLVCGYAVELAVRYWRFNRWTTSADEKIQ